MRGPAHRRSACLGPHQDVAQGADRGTGWRREAADRWWQGQHARHAAGRRREPAARQHLHEPVPEALASERMRRSVPRPCRRLCRRLRHPQPRLCGRGAGVDEGGDDEARADTQRGQDLAEECPTGALRLPRLLVRTSLSLQMRTANGIWAQARPRRACNGSRRRCAICWCPATTIRGRKCATR